MKNLVVKNYPGRIPDVRVMEELGFTPPSWKNWKPKFIEKADLDQMKYLNDDKTKMTYYRISYDKKERMWSVRIDDVIEVEVELEQS